MRRSVRRDLNDLPLDGELLAASSTSIVAARFAGEHQRGAYVLGIGRWPCLLRRCIHNFFIFRKVFEDKCLSACGHVCGSFWPMPCYHSHRSKRRPPIRHSIGSRA